MDTFSTPQSTQKESVFVRDVDPSNKFDSSTIPEGGELLIQFTGPAGGFTVEVVELKLCLPEIRKLDFFL